MGEFAATVAVVAALYAPSTDPVLEQDRNWCQPGYTVMLPDGREGVVTSLDAEICRVVTDGEAYVTPMPHFILEPVYPQQFAARAYR